MNEKRLYTIVLDYGGGTYISQIMSKSPKEAFTKWTTTVNEADLEKWGLTHDTIVELSRDDVTPLNGLLNAWCLSHSAKAGLILVNIIATKED